MKRIDLAVRFVLVAVGLFVSTGCGQASDKIAAPLHHAEQACIDEDGDGLCAAADCDDSDASLGTDCPVEPAADCTEGVSRECKVELGEHDGVKSCFEGVQVCKDGEWSACGEAV
jgi:hypothetical protein